MSTVEPMQKITVTFDHEGVKLSGSKKEKTCFSFIYGAGSRGLSPFESDLSGKRVGESVRFDMARDKLSYYMEHLYRPLLEALALPVLPQLFVLEGMITRVEKPQQREIIIAMKDYLGGRCGGSCNCGCH